MVSITRSDFTTRQLSLLNLLCSGHTPKQMADMLGISYGMIKFELILIRTKLRAKTTIQAVFLAIQAHVILLDPE